MNATTIPQVEIKTLADKAMLVRVKTKRQANSVKDIAATAFVDAHYGVNNAGQFNKKLFKGSKRFSDLNTSIYELTKYVNANSSPWLDGGWRLLPNVNYIDFTSAVRGLQSDVDTTVAVFNQHWAEEVQADMARLRDMASLKDYNQRNNLGVEVVFMPVPSEADFRVQVTEEDRAEFRRSMEEVETNATRELVARLIKPLRTLSDKLGTYTGEKGQRFHESTVDALTGIMDTMESLNISDDATVVKLVEDVRASLQGDIATPARLKHSQHARDNAKAKLDNILASF